MCIIKIINIGRNWMYYKIVVILISIFQKKSIEAYSFYATIYIYIYIYIYMFN